MLTPRCRFIVHIADLSALILIHELHERTTKRGFCFLGGDKRLKEEFL